MSTTSRVPISGIIIAPRNADISSARKSLSWCDEIVEATYETIVDYAAVRNAAMRQARHNWIFFLDSDEIVSYSNMPELQVDYGAYAVARHDHFWGQTLSHGEVAKVAKNGIIRLVNRESGHWTGKVHETFVTTDKVGLLSEMHIDHYPHPTIAAFLSSVNHYSTIRAHELAEAGTGVSALQLGLYPLGKFLYTYFLKFGFLDGPAGFVYSFMMAFHSFLARAKTYMITHSRDVTERSYS